MGRMINLRQLEAFRALMLAGTTVKAAAVLGVSQPVVSRLISDLELRTGIQLFSRAKGRLKPTVEADLLYRELERAFVGLDQIDSFMKGIKTVGGKLSIIATMPMAHGILPHAISRMRREVPDLDFTLRTVLSRDVRALLDTQQFDLAFTNFPIDYPSAYSLEFLRANGVCILPLGHELASRSVLTALDLADIPFIAMPPETRHRQKVDSAFMQSDIVPNITVQAQSGAIICELVAAGAGVSVVDEVTASAFATKGLELRPFLPKLTYEFRILVPLQREKSRQTEKLIKYAREYVAQAGFGA